MPRAKTRRRGEKSRERSKDLREITARLDYAAIDWEKGFNSGWCTAAKDQLSLNPVYRGTGMKFDRTDLSAPWYWRIDPKTGRVIQSPDAFAVVVEPTIQELREAKLVKRKAAKNLIVTKVVPHCKAIGLDSSILANLQFAAWDLFRRQFDSEARGVRELVQNYPTMDHWLKVGKPETTIHSIGGIQIKKRSGVNSIGRGPMQSSVVTYRERMVFPTIDPYEHLAVLALDRFFEAMR